MLFKPGKFLEQQLGADRLEDLGGSGRSNPRRGAEAEVDMVRQAFNLSHSHIVMARCGSEQFSDSVFGFWVLENMLAIFGAPGEVIPKIIPGMSGVVNGHALILARPPRSSPPLAIQTPRSDSLVPSTRACRAVVNLLS